MAPHICRHHHQPNAVVGFHGKGTNRNQNKKERSPRSNIRILVSERFNQERCPNFDVNYKGSTCGVSPKTNALRNSVPRNFTLLLILFREKNVRGVVKGRPKKTNYRASFRWPKLRKWSRQFYARAKWAKLEEARSTCSLWWTHSPHFFFNSYFVLYENFQHLPLPSAQRGSVLFLLSVLCFLPRERQQVFIGGTLGEGGGKKRS